jgi:hypothetical protein
MRTIARQRLERDTVFLGPAGSGYYCYLGDAWCALRLVSWSSAAARRMPFCYLKYPRFTPRPSGFRFSCTGRLAVVRAQAKATELHASRRSLELNHSAPLTRASRQRTLWLTRRCKEQGQTNCTTARLPSLQSLQYSCTSGCGQSLLLPQVGHALRLRLAVPMSLCL